MDFKWHELSCHFKFSNLFYYLKLLELYQLHIHILLVFHAYILFLQMISTSQTSNNGILNASWHATDVFVPADNFVSVILFMLQSLDTFVFSLEWMVELEAVFAWSASFALLCWFFIWIYWPSLLATCCRYECKRTAVHFDKARKPFDFPTLKQL